jgi:uncharacterized membrane protein
MTSLLIHIVLPIHIVAGGVGLVSGAAALFAAKGARLHRKSGMLFVCAMVALAVTGGGMAALQGDELTACVGLLTAYLVTTALVTVRPPAAGARWLNLGAMLVSLAAGLSCVAFGLDALASPGGEREFPPAPYFIFGSVALVGGVSDLRMIRTGGFRGARRLARHLWRMCFALLIAAISFFGARQTRSRNRSASLPYSRFQRPRYSWSCCTICGVCEPTGETSVPARLGKLEWQTASTKHHKNGSGCWAAVRGARNCAERSVRTAWS